MRDMIQQIDLFVYSGTGNTWKVAQCIAATAGKCGIGCNLLPIDANSAAGNYQPDRTRLLGLMAPTLGTIQPWQFFRFAFGLPRGKGQQVFLAATGAWTRIGKLFAPGFVGFGLYLAALILLLKGYAIAGIDGFGMPHNWTTLIPPYRASLEDIIHQELPAEAERFAEALLSGKKLFRRKGDLIVGLALFPLPFLFLLFGHKFLAKTMFAGDVCNGCAACANNCPAKAIRMLGAKHPRPYWTLKCEQCMRCAGYCPKQAVNCNSLLLLAFVAVSFAIPAEVMIRAAHARLFPQLAGLPLGVTAFLLYYGAMLLLAVAIYALFFLLGRIPAVNRVFSRLSFTRGWRKYKHPEITVTTLVKGEIIAAQANSTVAND
jgi:Pyruvate/2-oxoacid:ferredoxin oxidoreductase delta subunit